MNCRLTVVVDNTAPGHLVAEHGFALHLATPEGNILFDTGQQAALLTNMARLGLDPQNLAALVLSHGHYDHTGGVAEILKMNPAVRLYLHSAAFQPRYCRDGDLPTVVRMPLAAMEAISRHPDDLVHWLTRPTPFSSFIGITGPISRITDFEDVGGSFSLDPDGRTADTIRDDVAMWLHTPQGLVVCVGCCHSGLVNTLDYIAARTGETRIALIIGGLHLLNSSSQRLERTVAELGRFSILKVVACHCSGEEATAFLRENLEAEVSRGQAGLVVEF